MKKVPIYQKGIRWKIGDGININFLKDNWCHEENLLSLTGRDTSSADLNMRISDFISPNMNWNVTKLKHYVHSHIIPLITSVALPIHPLPNEKCWVLLTMDNSS